MSKTTRLHRVTTAAQSRVTLAQAVDEFLLAQRVGQRSPDTLSYYGKNLARFAAWCADAKVPMTVAQIQAGHIRMWLSHLQARPTLSDVGVQTYFRAVRAFFNWCEREEMLEVSPFRSGRLQCPKAAERLKPTVSAVNLRALLDGCKTGQTPLRDTALVLVLVDTGLRSAEVCGLHLGDVEGGRLRVMGKGAKERYVYVGARTDKAIRDYVRRERRPTCEDVETQVALFVGRKGVLTPDGVAQIIARRSEEAGCPLGKRVHVFRHTFAKLWIQGGGSLHDLQGILGHSTPWMTLQYGKAFGQDLEEAHKQYSPVERLDLGKRKMKE